MRQGVVEAGDWHVCGVHVHSAVGGGEGIQSKWMLSLIFDGLVGFVGDWWNFGSNCASAIFVSEIFWV